MRCVLRSWLKVADLTALSAEDAVRRVLGFGDTVRGLYRSEVWAFEFLEGADGPQTLERLARETNLLVNPNKHAHEIAGGESLHPRGNAWVLAARPGDGSDLAETLERHRLVSPAPAVHRGVLWELDLAPDTDRRQVLEELAVARERRRGLLTNPHMEDATLFLDPPTGVSLAGAMPW